MITVIYCTRSNNDQHKEHLIKTSGLHNKIEVIEIINNGESLTTSYNRGLKMSNNNIVVFCHDDISIETKQWGQKLIKLFNKNPDFGIIGVAGTKYMGESGRWWDKKNKMYGKVKHTHEGKSWLSEYSSDLNQNIEETVVVDGLFFAIDKTKIKKEFNEDFEGFHFYDVSFCFENYLEGVKNGVTTIIRINHKSIGMTNDKWESNRIKFSTKYQNFLPVEIPKIRRKGEKLKSLICISDYRHISYVKKLINNLLNDDYEINFCSNFNDLIKKDIKNNYVRYYPLSEPPGLKLGDGKWSLNINGVIQPSQPNMLYKLKEMDYDYFVVDDKNLYNVINTFFTDIQSSFIVRDINNIVVNQLIKNYVVFNENISIELESKYSISKDNITLIDDNSQNLIRNIKIASGWSNRGGSTVALINLTNELNLKGYNTTFYGPHEWHLDKCKSGKLTDLKLESDDILIVHFLNLQERPNVRKVILSCHEKNLYEVGKVKQFWDEVVFLNDKHRDYHNEYNGKFEVIPNLRQNLIKKNKTGLEKIAGIIGSFDENKQTHISIKRALDDGCEKIYLFGEPNTDYYNQLIKPLINDKVILKGFLENKQEMYDMIGCVYHSSKSEVATLVKDECDLTGVIFYGNEVTNNPTVNLTNDDIINKWINIIKK